MRKYYATEMPLPKDIKQVQRLIGARSKEERAATESVLKEFFTLQDDGWHNTRCDEEVARYQEKRAKAQRSAEARWSAKRSDSEGNANASNESMRTHSERNPKAMLAEQSEGNALQSPVSSLQSPDTSKETTPPPPFKGGAPPARPKFDPSSIPNLDLPSWERWVKYRAERKPALKAVSMQAAAEELAAFGPDQAAVVKQSIANGYQGLFALKVNGASAPKQIDRVTWRPPPDEDEPCTSTNSTASNP